MATSGKISKAHVAALKTRKAFLFQELTRIHDMVSKSSFRDEVEAETQLAALSRQEGSYMELVSEILTANSEEEGKEVVSTKEFSTIQALIDAIRKCCLKCKGRSESILTTPPTTDKLRLPKIHLPTFDGEIGEWNAFIEQYNTLIHNRPLSNVEKLAYLKSVLTREPLAIVNQYELRDASYAEAYQALTNRYNNPRLLASHYLSRILNYKWGNTFPKQFTSFLEIHRAATSNLKHLPIDELADYLLFELTYRNLPVGHQKAFDREQNPTTLPTLNDLFRYIDTLARTEELHFETYPCNPKDGTKRKDRRVLLGVSEPDKGFSCVHCNNDHPLYRCKSFVELPLTAKMNLVQDYGVCPQCLGSHKTSCRTKYTCRHCKKGTHHTLLCDQIEVPKNNTPTYQSENTTRPSCNACVATQPSTVLLGTIKVHMADLWGTLHEVRVVCDTGSQINIVTNDLVKRLGLRRFAAPVDIQTVAQGAPKVLGATNVSLQSRTSKEVRYECKAVILQSICNDMPSESLKVQLPTSIQTLQLADPEFRKPMPIDVLLGADACMDILSSQNPVIVKNNPTAIHTIFGYILTGRVMHSPTVHSYTFCTTTLDKTLRSFWESENIETTRRTVDDPLCEEHFRQTHQRDATGRYIVRLPFQPNTKPLGSNVQYGRNSLLRLENRFQRTPELFNSYSEVIKDYLEQGHMSLALHNETYVLPHHCVYKDSTSTSIRVVFNASSQDDTGYSLNDRLQAGPKLQNELPILLIGFRLHEVALQADIKQMFRNILSHQDDRRYQHILWRWSPRDMIRQYSLNTVTFGFTSSPYLAQRVLKQLVQDEGTPYPEASNAVLKHTFVDDFVTGAPSIEAATKLRQDLSELLAKGGFELRKWASSHPETLSQVPEDQKEQHFVFPTGDKGVKILGLLWNQTFDALQYHVTEFDAPVITKRTVLSYIARIWDCLGWVSPVVLKAKTFLQHLWLLQADWDDPLPTELATEWRNLTLEMPLLRQIRIPRRLPVKNSRLHLVGFSDASELAMAANVYLHCTSPNGECQSHLLISKTKLAPLKTWTIPRLELAAAVLMTSLVDYVKQSTLKDLPVHLYTDSQIVLAWLRIPPHNLKIFVANRVIQIKETLPEAIWGFVPGTGNPADLSSRGLKASQLLDNQLWWHGPTFLEKTSEHWPTPWMDEKLLEQCPETKGMQHPQALAAQLISPEPITECLTKFSSLTKLQRVVAYVLRYLANLRTVERKTGGLSAAELRAALLLCVKLTQTQYFKDDITAIQAGKTVSHRLQKLSPFLDSNQLVRAGGRLKGADSLISDAKHPLILPKECPLAALICDFYHAKLLHSGPKTTQAAIQQHFWILSLRQLLRKRIHLCLRCHKLSGTRIQPLMGDLPYTRVNVARPFTNVSIDFGGPITTKESRIRTSVRHKSYLCVFVCMAVKAVHLEAVSEKTTKGFLAAFTRFTSRRGVPRSVYSDCGRNFVGAARTLEDAVIGDFASAQGVEWHFAPPYAPNFNGLAEAAIKSSKRLLLRQIGEEILTFEEFSTLLCRVEAVLNSRPLTTISEDPGENLTYLSPAHFLIGDQLLHPPEPTEDALSLHDRWQRIQVKSQSFWKQWSREYLHTILQRQKWTKPGPRLRVGQVVLICGENLTPLQWPLGRIIALHYGTDNVARVATIRLKDKEVRRAVSKLLTLPEDR